MMMYKKPMYYGDEDDDGDNDGDDED